MIAHPANDIEAEAMADMAKRLNQMMVQKVALRSHADVSRFFDGLTLVEPGGRAGAGMAAEISAGSGERLDHVGRRGQQALILHPVPRGSAQRLRRPCRQAGRPPGRETAFEIGGNAQADPPQARRGECRRVPL